MANQVGRSVRLSSLKSLVVGRLTSLECGKGKGTGVPVVGITFGGKFDGGFWQAI